MNAPEDEITAPDSLFADSGFCWAKDLPPGRNQFVSFERRFTLPTVIPATLHLFADTRYRLFVNGSFVAYGPGRFVTAHPEYDSHDLAAFLKRGENLLRVEVNYYGCSSFQTMPDGLPGFIAAGGTADGAVSFATPGTWLSLIHRAWDPRSPLFSFAQNPIERCDTRILDKELAKPANHPVVTLPAESVPWAKPQPRSVPYPDYAHVRPSRIIAAGPVADSLRWGIQLHRDEPLLSGVDSSKEFRSFSTWIHSPADQRVSIDCFWCELELNGEALRIDYPGRLGNHGEAFVNLRSGWNFLSGNLELLTEQWPLMLGLPRSSGCTLHALPEASCRETFSLSASLPGPSILTCPPSPEGFRPPSGWSVEECDLSRITPARLTAWDSPEASLDPDGLPFSDLPPVATSTARAALWSFDFGDEFYGQTVVEVEAPEGSVLDVAYDDWKRADGCVNLYHSNPFTDAADRFILQGGRQRIEVLNPRGGIFLQLVLRAPAGSPPVPLTLHDLSVRRRTTLNTCKGSFSCGDPLLDWAWRISVHTLQTSTDEAYADCPWRERGSYIGDSLVNFHLHLLLSANLSVARRTFDLFGKAQRPDGQLACCAPSWLRPPHEDFTLLWIQAVRDYWARTGDMAFAEAQWPIIERIIASPTWKPDDLGLWDTTGMRVFIDWGVLPSEREGADNAAVNILRIAALRAAAEIAAVLGKQSRHEQLGKEAERLSAALVDRLWNEKAGRLDASAGAGTPALHANILALRYGIGPADRILSYLEPLLRRNLSHGLEKGQFSGFAELYFLSYLLPALADHGRADLALDLIRDHYGYIRSLGTPTLPECFNDAAAKSGSCCHSWSGSAAIFATRHLLGIRPSTPGNPDAYLLAPVAPGIDHAEGSIPHARGSISIRWKRKGNRFAAHATLPSGITLLTAPNVDLTVG